MMTRSSFPHISARASRASEPSLPQGAGRVFRGLSCKAGVLALFTIVAALSSPAWAAGCTVTPAAAICVAAKTTAPYRLVAIDNEGAAAICVTDDGSTPVCGAAGTYTIAPGQTRTWSSANVVFPGPFTAVSATGSQPVTYTAD
jgi:hypothetical protein